jgi:hypothetical protein
VSYAWNTATPNTQEREYFIPNLFRLTSTKGEGNNTKWLLLTLLLVISVRTLFISKLPLASKNLCKKFFSIFSKEAELILSCMFFAAEKT